MANINLVSKSSRPNRFTILVNVFMATIFFSDYCSSFQNEEIVIGLMFSGINDPHSTTEATATVTARMINDNRDILSHYHIKVFVMPFAKLGNLGYNLLSIYNYKKILKLLATEGKSDVNPDRLMAILGPTNTKLIEVLNEYMVKENVLQLNYDAGGESLTDVDRFPYLFNIAQPLHVYEGALLTLLKQMNWRRIAVLYQNDGVTISDGIVQIAKLFETNAEGEGIDIQFFGELFSNVVIDRKNVEFRRHLTQIKERDIRIIILFVKKDTLTETMCEAYKLGMYGKKYVYLSVFGELVYGWMGKDEVYFSNCSKHQLLAASKSLLNLARDAADEDHTRTVANITVAETKEKILREVQYINKNNNKTLEVSYKVPDKVLFVHDAIWALAYSINNIVMKNQSFVSNFHNEKKDSGNLEKLSNEYAKANFQGASGWFNFTTVKGRRYRDGGILLQKYVAIRNASEEFSAIAIIDDKLNMSAYYVNGTPRDGPLVKKNIIQLPDTLVITLWVVAGCGILMATLFLLINIIWRNVKLLKLSSPHINSLICVGCILSYIAVICYGLDTRTIDKSRIATSCNVMALILSTGFTLIFGSLFSKTWRIYRIFTKSQAAKYVVIKDLHLFSIVLILLIIDVAIFSVRILVLPYQLEEQIVKEIFAESSDTLERDIVHRCRCESQSQYLLVMFIYKGMLMLFGLFVAYETRSIKVAAINDSSYIGAAVYNCALFVTLGAIVVYSLHSMHRFEESYIVFALCILQATTITLCLVFVPKIIMLITKYDDPNFKNGRPVIGDNSNSEYLRSDVHSSTAGDTISRRWANIPVPE